MDKAQYGRKDLFQSIMDTVIGADQEVFRFFREGGLGRNAFGLIFLKLSSVLERHIQPRIKTRNLLLSFYVFPLEFPILNK